MVRLLVLTILLTTLLSGCARNRFRDAPSRPDAMSTSAAGKRIVFKDQNDQPMLKIRARKNAWKVYDENFKATGFVRWPVQNAPQVENLVREPLAQFQRGASSDEVFELPGHLRIEKIEDGWAVFDQDAKLLGLFEHESTDRAPQADRDLPSDILPDPDEAQADPPETDNLKSQKSKTRWTLRASYNTSTQWTASQDARQIIARHHTGKVFTTNAAYFSAPAVLAGELDGLTALERAALAAWFMHMMPDA